MNMPSNGSGLYFISNGDFRECRIKYIIETTNDNQSVEVSPYAVRTLGIFKNKNQFKYPWSIKTDGTELEFAGNECIRQGSTGSVVGDEGICVETPIFQFASAGKHMVKLYDESATIYQIYFRNNPSITHLYLNWENIPTKVDYATALSMNIINMDGLKYLYWGIPST